MTSGKDLSVKDLADHLQVTRQTIYNYLNELKGNVTKYEYSKYIKTLKGSLHITNLGQEVIKDMYLRKNVDEEEQIERELKEQARQAEISKDDTKDKLISVLEEQLKIKDKQIDDYISTIKSLSERLRETMYVKALETQQEEQGEAESFTKRLKYLFTGKRN